MLDAINRRRALHDLPPLVWSVNAAKQALEHAKNYKFHRTHSFFGDYYVKNMAQGKHQDALYYVWQWYDEQRGRYRFDNKGRTDDGRTTSNFAALIWRDFKFVGCALWDFGPSVEWRYLCICNFGPERGTFFTSRLPANVVPLKSTWPAGWTPLTTADLARITRPEGYNVRKDPPWEGYKYVYKPPPLYTGEDADIDPLDNQANEWRFFPHYMGVAEPLWDEQQMPRYADAVAQGHGRIPLWEDNPRLNDQFRVMPVSEAEIAYQRFAPGGSNSMDEDSV